MVLKYQGLDLYFHMSNHYKKLKNVKSVIDSCPPKGKDGTSRGRPAIRPHSHICSTPKSARRRGEGFRHPSLKRHDCLTDENKGLIYPRSASLPPRPPTRRNPSDVPNFVQVQVRVKSSSPPRRNVSQNTEARTSPRKNSNKGQKKKNVPSANSSPTTLAENPDTPIVVYQNTFAFNKRPVSSNSAMTETTVSDAPSGTIQSNGPTSDDNNRSNTSPPNEKSGSEEISVTPIPAPRSFQNGKVEEKRDSTSLCVRDHEYIQFSLRITEDIIRNELYTSKDMKRVFNSHIEANRGRLDMQRMKEQIEQLSRELNISLQDLEEFTTPSKLEVKKMQQIFQDNLVCICGSLDNKEAPEGQQCECTAPRTAPFECTQHPKESTQVAELPDKDEDGTSKKSSGSDHSYVKRDVHVASSTMNDCFTEGGSRAASVAEHTENSLYSHRTVSISEEKKSFDRSIDNSESGSGYDGTVNGDEESEEIVIPSIDTATLEEIVSTIDNTIPAQCHCKIKDTVLPMDTVANPLKAVEKSESEIQTYALLEAQSLYVTSKYVSPSKKSVSKCTCTVEAKSTCTCIEDAIKNEQSISPDICKDCKKLKSETTSTTSLIIEDDSIMKYSEMDSYIPRMISTKSTSNTADEYILLHGPIYVPKSSIQFTMNTLKPSNETIPTTYSVLHSKANNTKHDMSFSSIASRKPEIPKPNIPELESAIFREPPKYLSLYQRSGDYQVPNTPPSSCVKMYENLEYDVTPQKDCMDDYCIDFKDAATSFSVLENAELEKLSSVTDNPLKIDLNLDFRKLFQVSEETMTQNDTLLLGDDYKIDTVNESALPYPISLFYPSISTQTCLEDRKSSASTIITARAREIELSSAAKPPLAAQEAEQEEKAKESAEGVARPKRQSVGKPEPKKRWSILEIIEEPKDDSVPEVEQPKEKWNVIAEVEELERENIHDVEEDSEEEEEPEDEINVLKQESSEEDEEPKRSIFGTPANNSEEAMIPRPPAEWDSLEKPIKRTSFHDKVIIPPAIIQPDDSDLGSEILSHLDKEPSLTVSESQKFAIEKAVADLDKVRHVENPSERRKSSLQMLANKIEDVETNSPPRVSVPNILFQDDSKKDKDKKKEKEKPVVAEPVTTPPPSDPEIETVCCGLKKLKKKKETKAATKDEKDEAHKALLQKASAGYEEQDSNRRKSIRFEGERDLSGANKSAEDFKSPFAETMGSVSEESSSTTMQSAAVQKSTEPSDDDIPSTRHSNYNMPDAGSVDTKPSETSEEPQKPLNEMQALRQDIIKRNSLQSETNVKNTIPYIVQASET